MERDTSSQIKIHFTTLYSTILTNSILKKVDNMSEMITLKYSGNINY